MKLLPSIRKTMTDMEYTPRTIRAYTQWMERYIRHHHLQHPTKLGRAGVAQYINHLSSQKRVAAGTQNQALDALILMYDFIGQPIDSTGLRAKMPRRQPETAGHDEIMQIINQLTGRERIMGILCYGSGLSVADAASLKIAQLNFEENSIIMNTRTTVLPEMGRDELRRQIALAGAAPGNIAGYLFPSRKLHGERCYHVSPSSLQKAMLKAANKTGLNHRRITPRVLRASFIIRLLEAGYNARTVQELAGFATVEQVMVYQRILDIRGMVSPLDNIEKNSANY